MSTRISWNSISPPFLGGMLVDLAIDESNLADTVVPLTNVNAQVLAKVLEFCAHHQNDPVPAAAENTETDKVDIIISDWDAEFLKVDQGLLYELILAANYLDIRNLLDVSAKTIANMIKGKTPEEIRKIFNVPCDFTEADLEALKKENAWCEEK